VGAVEAGFLDRAVPADAVLDAAVEAGRAMSALHRRAYAGTVRSLRGATLETIARQIEADRAAGSVPAV
jgi:enoyl-CoA hydratase